MFAQRLLQLSLFSASLGSLQCGTHVVAVLDGRGQQRAKDDAEFRAQAAALVDQYIPPDAWGIINPAVISAAAAVKVTGNPSQLFVSALAAETPDPWFYSAIPPQFNAQVAALESAIDELRPGDSTATKVVEIPTIVPVVTTDSNGQPFTTTVSTTVLSTQTGSQSPTHATDGGEGDGDGDGEANDEEDGAAAIAVFARNAVAGFVILGYLVIAL